MDGVSRETLRKRRQVADRDMGRPIAEARESDVKEGSNAALSTSHVK